jgi:hypothetical protein
VDNASDKRITKRTTPAGFELGLPGKPAQAPHIARDVNLPVVDALL